ncbi:MAG: hypothetical protein KBT01_00545 [Clostridiales bacterium]|nr:hypothetical protein [Candidatus Blautia equi]
MNYLNKRKNIPFEIQAFSSVETLVQYAEETYIELLLISSRAMRKDVRDLGIGQIIILAEGNYLPELEQYPSVYKYQASADVVREVLACYGEEKAYIPAAFPVMKKHTVIYGFYSPLGRCLKTSLALTMGQLLAKNKAVLYLNLEGYSGLEGLLNRSFSCTLSDLLYYIKQDPDKLLLKLNGAVHTVNGMDFIPPVQNPADILGTSFEDMEKLLQEITLHTSYEALILDFGNDLPDMYPLLDQCWRIFMPVLEDPVSRCKIRQFEELLKSRDYAQVLAKTEKLYLPERQILLSGDSPVEQLLFTELGTYVKDLLDEE